MTFHLFHVPAANPLHPLYSQACIVRLMGDVLAELQMARRLDNNLEIVAALGYTYGRAGRRLEAQQVLDELQQLSRTRYVSPMLGALIATGMGECDQALGWLEQAYADRAQMMSELKAEPAFDPLREDPRFADLLRLVGLEAGRAWTG